MKLDTKERLQLLNLLPREGDVTTLRVVFDLRRALSFSEKELKALKFRNVEKQLVWDASKGTIKDIPVSEVPRKMIQEAFKQLDEKKKLNIDLLSLYERFHTKLKDVKNG